MVATDSFYPLLSVFRGITITGWGSLMCQESSKVSLGFLEQDVEKGTHICLVYTSDKERDHSLLNFLLSGLEAEERNACFSNQLDAETLSDFLGKHGFSYYEAVQKNALSLSGTNEVYFQDGVFDPERMLATLKKYYQDSRDMGFESSRVIGEMVPEVENVPGGERLLEYESRVTQLLREAPITTVCQYDARSFDGATILEVLKVHPKMIVNGMLVENPFYITPEDYLPMEHHG